MADFLMGLIDQRMSLLKKLHNEHSQLFRLLGGHIVRAKKDWQSDAAVGFDEKLMFVCLYTLFVYKRNLCADAKSRSNRACPFLRGKTAITFED